MVPGWRRGTWRCSILLLLIFDSHELILLCLVFERRLWKLFQHETAALILQARYNNAPECVQTVYFEVLKEAALLKLEPDIADQGREVRGGLIFVVDGVERLLLHVAPHAFSAVFLGDIFSTHHNVFDALCNLSRESVLQLAQHLSALLVEHI